MKLNIKYKVRDRIREHYIHDPVPSVKSLMMILEIIASIPNLVKVELL